MNGNFHRVICSCHIGHRKYSRQQKCNNGFKTVDIEGMKVLMVFICPWHFVSLYLTIYAVFQFIHYHINALLHPR